MSEPAAPVQDWSHSLELSPAFHDLDPMQIVWHGHYLKYLELVRCALLQRYDYDYPQMAESGYAWPIVDLRTKYVRPARYGQRLKLYAQIVEWEYRLKIRYLISDADSGEVMTRAHTVQVAVDARSGEMCYVSPPVLRERLGIAP
ncbi:MAG: acyl-CoA thioesterase [Xanthomonadales bacterium]|nr:acyl-CoA thioesterase [Xanthomonadales bacterium]